LFDLHPKDHSTKGWLQLSQWFLRRRFKCESLRRTTGGRRTPSDGKSSHGLWPDYCKTSIERLLSEHGNDSFQITIHCSTCIRFHGFTLQHFSVWIFIFFFLYFDFLCFNATFNNISAISWRPVLVVEEVLKLLCNWFW
jgi:hypothetical protein